MQFPLTVPICPPCKWCGGFRISLCQSTGNGHNQASSGLRDGTSHIPRESNHFPGDQSGDATPVTCGGPPPRGRSSSTKTLSSCPPLVHARSAPESQVGEGCPKIPCFQSTPGSGHSQAASIFRNGNNHISRENCPARKHGWMPPQKGAASSMRRDPRNTSCAADRVSRDGSPADKSGQALPIDGCGGPLADGWGYISGIQVGKDMPGLLAPIHENGEVVTGKKEKHHRVENKPQRQMRAEKMADAQQIPSTAARTWRSGRLAPRIGRRTLYAARRYTEPLHEGGGPPAEPGGLIGAKL